MSVGALLLVGAFFIFGAFAVGVADRGEGAEEDWWEAAHALVALGIALLGVPVSWVTSRAS